MVNYKNLKEQIELICSNKVILIAGHKNTDYDSITSSVALAHILRKLGYTAYALIENKDMDKTSWLDASFIINEYYPNSDYVFIMLDANQKSRLGVFETLFDNATITFCIDHHEDSKNEATYSFIDEKISSTAEMISNLALEFEDVLDKDISTLLYAGIASDTNSFYKRTTPKTMDITSKLLSYGANSTFAIKNACKNMTLSEATILSDMIANIKFDVLHYVILDRKNTLYSDVPYSTIFKKCASYIYDLADVSVFALLLTEHDGSVSGLIRSNTTIDIDELAKSFGGGGHKKAAGFESKLDAQVIISKIKEYILNS